MQLAMYMHRIVNRKNLETVSSLCCSQRLGPCKNEAQPTGYDLPEMQQVQLEIVKFRLVN